MPLEPCGKVSTTARRSSAGSTGVANRPPRIRHQIGGEMFPLMPEAPSIGRIDGGIEGQPGVQAAVVMSDGQGSG